MPCVRLVQTRVSQKWDTNSVCAWEDVTVSCQSIAGHVDYVNRVMYALLPTFIFITDTDMVWVVSLC